MRLGKRISLALRVLTYRPGNLMAHAERELGVGFDIELQELLLVFGSQGHSGASAAITAGLLGKLLRFEPIGPLTGEPEEWFDHGNGVFQNKRCGRVFKQADRFDGQAYDLDGIVWRDPDGCTFTNRESMVPVVFPYTPQTEFRDRPITTTGALNV
jgi:hypothetical protein